MGIEFSVLKIIAGRTSSVFVRFLTAPIVARIFVPEDFGIRQIFISIMQFFTPVACFRYEFSIPLSADDRDATSSFALSVVICVLFSLVILLFIPLAGDQVAGWFGYFGLVKLLWLLPIGILLVGLQKAFSFWASYKMEFGFVAFAFAMGAAIAALFPILWIFLHDRSPVGLLVALFAGYVTTVLLLLIRYFRKLGLRSGNVTYSSMIAIARRHKKFPAFDVWSELLRNAERQMPVIILGLSFPKAVVGYYSLGNRIACLPILLLSESIAQVFLPVAAKKHNQTRDLSGMVSKTFRRLVQLGIMPMGTLFFLGPFLFSFAFGAEWREAGIYLQILSFDILLYFICFPFLGLFSILQRQDMKLVYNILLLLVRVASLLLGIALGGPKLSLASYSMSGVIGNGLLICWVLHSNGISLWWGFKAFLGYSGLTCVLLMPAIFLTKLTGNGFAVIASLMPVFAAYVYILCKIDPGFRVAVGDVFKRLRAQDKSQVGAK